MSGAAGAAIAVLGVLCTAPVLSVLVGALALGEAVAASAAVGPVLILGGSWLAR